MPLHGIKRAAFHDPATGLVADLRKLSDQSVFRNAPLETEERTPTGTPMWGGDHSLFETQAFEEGAATRGRLEGWMRSHTPVSLTAIGEGQVIRWQERDPVLIVRDETKGALGGQAGYKVRIERRGHGSHTIEQLRNVLTDMPWREGEGDLEGRVPGWEIEGASNVSFGVSFDADGVLIVEKDEGPSPAVVYRDVVFPLPGVDVTLSVDVIQVAGAGAIRIDQLAHDGTLLESSSHVVLVAGRRSHSVITAAAVYTLRVFIVSVTDNGQAEMHVRHPALRIDGSADYTED